MQPTLIDINGLDNIIEASQCVYECFLFLKTAACCWKLAVESGICGLHNKKKAG